MTTLINISYRVERALDNHVERATDNRVRGALDNHALVIYSYLTSALVILGTCPHMPIYSP